MEQKHRFLNQFGLLTQDQQIYAFNKFLFTPQEVQQFAINQSMSLKSEILAAAKGQEEINKVVKDPKQTSHQKNQRKPRPTSYFNC